MGRLTQRLGQLVLDLFGAAPAPEASSKSLPTVGAEAERWGRRGGPRMISLADLTLVFSRRMKRSWRLERPRTRPVLHLPEQLREAPEEVWEALGDWVIAQMRPSPGSRLRARLASRIVFEWMGTPLEREPKGSPAGAHHDLQAIFNHLNQAHFNGRMKATIRWSPRPGGLSTHRIIQTAEGMRHLITIGQVYDHPSVPLFAVEGVVYHEMLHMAHPPRKTGPLKRHVHHREFREAEQAFPGYHKWKTWEATEMHRLLRRVRRQAKTK